MPELRGAIAAAFASTDPEVLLEGRAGTGKSMGWLTKIHHNAKTYPGCRQLVTRQTRASCTESVLVTFEEKVLGPTHPLVVSGPGRINRHSHDYPNGSTVVWGGLDHPERLFSTEWDLIYVAEATEITLDAWEKFGRAMRNNKMPYQQRVADCNPGAPAHWLNQRANPCDDLLRDVKTRADYQRLQRYNHGAQEKRMRRLVSVHHDNPAYFDLKRWEFTPMGRAYLAELSSLTGHRRTRLFDGRWKSAEGVVYAEFDDAKHVLPPFNVQDWPVHVGYDPGYDKPAAVLWFAIAPNGAIFIIDEIYSGGLSIEQLAEMIYAKSKGRNVINYWGDPQHIFSRTAQSPTPIVTQFKKLAKHPIGFRGWPRTGGNKDSMVTKVRTRLINGTLQVFSNCTYCISEFQSWRYKRTAAGEMPSGDDKYEDNNDHCMDVVKGVLATPMKFAPGKIEVSGGEEKDPDGLD